MSHQDTVVRTTTRVPSSAHTLDASDDQKEVQLILKGFYLRVDNVSVCLQFVEESWTVDVDNVFSNYTQGPFLAFTRRTPTEYFPESTLLRPRPRSSLLVDKGIVNKAVTAGRNHFNVCINWVSLLMKCYAYTESFFSQMQRKQV